MTVAAIDIGTNSTRLLVLDASGAALVRRSEITRLGRAIDSTSRLDPEGITRTLDVLAAYRAELDEHAVRAVTVAGTAAVRRAGDASDFLAAVERVVGATPIVLSGDDEARLTFEGATRGLATATGGAATTGAAASFAGGPAPVLVVDLGGGSTELAVGAVGSGRTIGDGTPGGLEVVSMPLGCVTLTEAELASDPPRPEELTNAIAAAADALADARRALPRLDHVRTVVGVGGTISTVAAVELGLATWDRDRVHGLMLSRAQVEDVFRTLATEPLADRVHNPGLQPARADVIVGGCCILVALLRNLPADELRVADTDLLDALAHRLLA